jgi:SAM-dependent methyltransferase
MQSAAMRPDLLEATFRCPQCGFFASTLPVQINAVERIDEEKRALSLKPIREDNFRRLLEACATYLPQGARLLDVGCAHGWFLEAAKRKGYRATGIEPDRHMAQQARAAGHEVVVGFFPESLPPGEGFDAVTFNDVFEHLEDLERTLEAVRDRLKPGGLLVINLPVSDGLIFRLARAAARLGIRGPLARLWQQGLPSPHRSYFSVATLRRFVEPHRFILETSGTLTSLKNEGLYQRIRYDRGLGAGKAVAIYLVARALIPIVGLFPSDIRYFIFRTSRQPACCSAE